MKNTYIAAARRIFPGDVPFRGHRRILDLDHAGHIKRRVKGLVHELLEDLFVDPGAADSDLNLTGVQVFRLRLFQRRHIDLKGWILLCSPLGLAELLAHIA